MIKIISETAAGTLDQIGKDIVKGADVNLKTLAKDWKRAPIEELAKSAGMTKADAAMLSAFLKGELFTPDKLIPLMTKVGGKFILNNRALFSGLLQGQIAPYVSAVTELAAAFLSNTLGLAPAQVKIFGVQIAGYASDLLIDTIAGVKQDAAYFDKLALAWFPVYEQTASAYNLALKFRAAAAHLSRLFYGNAKIGDKYEKAAEAARDRDISTIKKIAPATLPQPALVLKPLVKAIGSLVDRAKDAIAKAHPFDQGPAWNKSRDNIINLLSKSNTDPRALDLFSALFYLFATPGFTTTFRKDLIENFPASFSKRFQEVIGIWLDPAQIRAALTTALDLNDAIRAADDITKIGKAEYERTKAALEAIAAPIFGLSAPPANNSYVISLMMFLASMFSPPIFLLNPLSTSNWNYYGGKPGDRENLLLTLKSKHPGGPTSLAEYAEYAIRALSDEGKKILYEFTGAVDGGTAPGVVMPAGSGVSANDIAAIQAAIKAKAAADQKAAEAAAKAAAAKAKAAKDAQAKAEAEAAAKAAAEKSEAAKAAAVAVGVSQIPKVKIAAAGLGAALALYIISRIVNR